MLAAIDIHKAVFQTAVLDPRAARSSRSASRRRARRWSAWAREVGRQARGGRDRGDDRLAVGRAGAAGARHRGAALTDPGQASALQGNRSAAEDRPARRALAGHAAGARDVAEAWLAPEEIQRLRDQTRLRKALADDHTRWAQRLHALLVHEGWPCSRGSLLTDSGRRWVAAIRLRSRRARPDRGDAQRDGDAWRTRSI